MACPLFSRTRKKTRLFKTGDENLKNNHEISLISDDRIIISRAMYIQRSLSKRLLQLAGVFPAIAVIGARQVGKSTLLTNLFAQNAETVVFDPVIDVENARKDPDLFLANHKTPLVLDEIQHAPEVISAVKRHIDRDRHPGQFLMTGSQQWGVMKTMAESLAGRVVFLDLEGFTLGEIADPQDPTAWLAAWLETPEILTQSSARLSLKRTLYEQLWRGWLPEVQFVPLDIVPTFHDAYMRTYVERDVRLLADVSDLEVFGRFVRLVATLTAQEINHSQLGRDIGVTPQTAKRWLDILKGTFQWFEVPAFSGNAVKRVSGKPKGYIADTGFACAAQTISSPLALGGHPLLGSLFETAVAGELRKQSSVMPTPPKVYHWRSHGGAEVDFVLERDGRYYPIEVKATTRPTQADLRGIAAFRKTYPNLSIQRGLVLSPTEKILRLSEQDYALPWDTTVGS